VEQEVGRSHHPRRRRHHKQLVALSTVQNVPWSLPHLTQQVERSIRKCAFWRDREEHRRDIRLWVAIDRLVRELLQLHFKQIFSFLVSFQATLFDQTVDGGERIVLVLNRFGGAAPKEFALESRSLV